MPLLVPVLLLSGATAVMVEFCRCEDQWWLRSGSDRGSAVIEKGGSESPMVCTGSLTA